MELIMRVSEKNGKTEVKAMREVVRCADCEHNYNGDGEPMCYVTDLKLSKDDFCSRGRKRHDTNSD